MDFIEIEIVQWFKHQPRKDIKHPSWFAMSNRILEDAKLFCLPDAEWKCLLYIFTQASQQNSNFVKIYYDHAKRICGLSKSIVNSTISRLCDADVTRPLRERIRDTTLQDTTLQNNTEHSIAQSGDFADFWILYPRKVGKGKAEKSYKREIRLGTKHADLLAARDRYRSHCEKNQTESRFIKHGSTFMAEWKDWLDPETGKSDDFSEKTKLEDLDLSSIFKPKVVGNG